jgi:pyrrolidone-carboxylate peptidase
MTNGKSSGTNEIEHPFTETTIIAEHLTKATIEVPRKPISFIAIDGTASPDADAFAREMNEVRSITPRKATPIKVTTLNLAEKLRSDASHTLAKFVRGPPRASEAFDFQRKGADVIESDDTKEAGACRDLFKKAGFTLDGDEYGADIMYVAMHANLRGVLSFNPDEDSAKREDWKRAINLFNPAKDELDWKTVKWVIFASCGTMSIHYRYFGIPGHARDDKSEWAHHHQLDPNPESKKFVPKKYVLSHYYPALQWLREIRKHAPKLHGVLGFWDKSPGGDVGGFPDVVIAKEFVERLKKGQTFLEAWKQHGGANTWAWSAIVDEKYANETLADLATNKLGEPGERKWMYASLYTGPPEERRDKPVPIPVKQAFLEANQMDKYNERPPSGVFRLHHDLALPLRRTHYYPGDLIQKRKDTDVKYPVGDVVESFAMSGKHYSSLSIDDMKSLLKEAIDESGRELTDDDLKTTYRPVKVLVAGFYPFKESGINYNSSQIMAEYLEGRVFRIDTDIGSMLAYVSGIVLPVWWYDAADWLVKEIKLGYPDIVIGLGMKGYDPKSTDSDDFKIEIEVNALNTNETSTTDNKHNTLYPNGRTSKDAIDDRAQQDSDRNKDSKTTDPSKVRDDGPQSLPNSDIPDKVLLPYDRINDALNSEPKAISSFVDRPTPSELDDPYKGNAGTYMCNQLFYNLLYHNLSSIGERKFKYNLMTGFIHIPALPKLSSEEKQSRFRQSADTIVRVCVEEFVKRELYKQLKPMPLESKSVPVPSATLPRSDWIEEPFYEWDVDVWGG